MLFFRRKQKPDVLLKLIIRDRGDVRKMIDCLREIKKLYPDLQIRAEFREED